MGCVAPLKSGSTMIAGYGFCSILTPDGKERKILAKGSFYSLASDGVTSLVVSSSKVFAVNEGGVVASMDLVEGALLPHVHLIDGHLALFAPGNGTYLFSNGVFSRTGDYSWADGQQVHSIADCGPDFGWVAMTNKGFFHSLSAGRMIPMLPDLWLRLKDHDPDGAILFNNQLVVSSYFDGLEGYSTEDSRQLWTLPPSEFGGSIFFIKAIEDGLMVGSSSGIFVVPDPSRYSYRKLSAGDLHAVIQSPTGPILSIGSKLYRIDGSPLDFPDRTISVLPFQGGYVVASFGGKIQLPTGRQFSFTDRDVPQMVGFGDGFAAVHGTKLSVFQNNSFNDVSVPGSVDSVAAVDTQLIAGTDRGAFVLSRNGHVDNSFGEGYTTVKALGDHGAVVFDSRGRLFDSTGFILGTFPFSELLSAVSWNGSTVLLGRMPNGSSSIVTLASSHLVASLDLPVEAPLALAVDKGKLCVIASGQVLEVSDPLPLKLPTVGPQLVTLSGSETLSLPPSDDTALLLVPPARLGPWSVPSYQYRVGNDKWETVSPGARMLIPRLDYGHSTIDVRESAGNEARVTSFEVYRAYPYWMRWPAFVLYALGTAGVFWGILKWRMRRLANEAIRLQAIVDEKTVDLKRAQATREQFFSTLSHEIRNPLNGVVGLCDILADAPAGSIGPREKRIVNTLRGCAGQLRGILDDILDFSRIDRGEIQLSSETFDLVNAVEGSVRAVDVGLQSSDLVLPNDPIWVSGDCGKLRQIVTNLASNGMKYGIPQRIRVTLATEITREGKLGVQIAVSNTGVTIPEEEIPALFKGFSRGEDAIRRHIPGHGLGLAVSKRMAEAMGGSLTAQSHEGLTVFSLNVVLAISDAPILVTPTIHKPRLSKALAIEDEGYNRMVLGHILGQLGYEVDWAVDGASALERIRSQAYDLVLTDYLLPDITGAELASQILKEAKNPKPPIVAVTAYSTHDKISELSKSGVSQIVSKPVSLEKLRTAIMGLSIPTGRRSLDVAPVSAACNFAPLLATNGGVDALAGYAGDLLQAWAWTCEILSGDLEEAAKAVHAIRSRLLVVEAVGAGQLAAQLESAVRLARAPDMRRLADLLTPIIENIAAQAQARASGERSRSGNG